jgi:hypothetical protein
MENTYYQYLDDNNVLQESVFLPVGVFSLIASAMLIGIIIIKIIIERSR